MNPRRLVLLAVLLLGGACSLAAQSQVAQGPVFLVHDLETDEDASSDPLTFTDLGNGRAIFLATSSTDPSQSDLWVTDGTSAGTVRLRSMPFPSRDFSVRAVLVGERALLYRSIRPGLWSTDGTTEGTFELMPGTINSVHFNPARSIGFISAFTGTATGNEIFVTDGTTTGTQPVAMSDSNVLSVAFTSTPQWTFLALGEELWRSDGTEAGTSLLLSDIARTPFFTIFSAGAHVIVKRRGANDQPDTFWRTDGTTSGLEVIPQPNPDIHLDLLSITVMDDDMVLLVGSDLHDFEGPAALYRLNPQAGPITELATFDAPLTENELAGISEALFTWFQRHKAGGLVYFTPRSEAHGFELWRSDGTASGTHLVRELCPGPCSSDVLLTRADHLGGELFFPARSESRSAFQLWRTRGGAASTVVDTNFDDALCNAFFPKLRAVGDALLVSFETGLWLTRGTATDTTLITPERASHLTFTGNFGNGMLFGGSGPQAGSEPWFTDGTAVGTALIKNIATGKQFSNPRDLVAAPTGDRVFYTRPSGDLGGDVLWTVTGRPTGQPALRRGIEGELRIRAG